MTENNHDHDSQDSTAKNDGSETQNSAADAGSESQEEGAEAQSAADDAVIGTGEENGGQ